MRLTNSLTGGVFSVDGGEPSCIQHYNFIRPSRLVYRKKRQIVPNSRRNLDHSVRNLPRILPKKPEKVVSALKEEVCVLAYVAGTLNILATSEVSVADLVLRCRTRLG